VLIRVTTLAFTATNSVEISNRTQRRHPKRCHDFGQDGAGVTASLNIRFLKPLIPDRPAAERTHANNRSRTFFCWKVLGSKMAS